MANLTKKARVSLKSKRMNSDKAVKSDKKVKSRDLTILASIRGEVRLSSKANNSNEKHYKRRSKHAKRDLGVL